MIFNYFKLLLFSPTVTVIYYVISYFRFDFLEEPLANHNTNIY
mgnify:FL=1